MKIILLISMLLSSLSFAGDSKHMRLALEFEDLSSSKDKTALIQSVAPMFIEPAGHTQEEEERIKSFLVQVFESDEYRRAKAKSYLSVFSEAELEKLIELVKNPAYKMMNARRHMIAVSTQKQVIALLQNKLPEYRALRESHNKRL